jgi:hypothetical protein
VNSQMAELGVTSGHVQVYEEREVPSTADATVCNSTIASFAPVITKKDNCEGEPTILALPPRLYTLTRNGHALPRCTRTDCPGRCALCSLVERVAWSWTGGCDGSGTTLQCFYMSTGCRGRCRQQDSGCYEAIDG